MKKPTKKGPVPKVTSKTTTVKLDEMSATKIELAYSRAESAQNALAARKAELDNIVTQARAHYEENGKYVVVRIDPSKREVERALAPFRPAAEPAGAPPSGGDQPTG